MLTKVRCSLECAPKLGSTSFNNFKGIVRKVDIKQPDINVTGGIRSGYAAMIMSLRPTGRRELEDSSQDTFALFG
jgi:hypothetical protein